MGMDIYCLICGGPTGNLTEKDSTHNWLKYITGINNEEKEIVLEDPDDYGQYDNFKVSKIYWHKEDIDYGVMAHDDCIKLLETKLDYKLRFSDVCRLVDDYMNLIKNKKTYGEVTKYIDQYFDFDKALSNDRWILESPLSNKRNESRILKIWDKLVKKFKKNKPRPSPCESATLFKKGKKLIGHDKNMWIVVEDKSGKKRWNKFSNMDDSSYHKNMDYKNKYLKYKQKYNKLKNQVVEL